MADISASQVKKLREQTGAGLMDCKKALTENNGDHEAAVEWLRKKGAATAEKKASRSTSEGVIARHLSVDGKSGTIVEICLLYTSPSPRDKRQSRMPSSA